MDFLDDANNLMNKMKLFIEKDDLSYEEDEKLQELYYEVEELLERAEDYLSFDEKDENRYNQLKHTKSRFKSISKQFENPEVIRQTGMDIMFPDEDSQAGFDWTLE